jgi:hypothetical protein
MPARPGTPSRWTVLGVAPGRRAANRGRLYRCRCACGAEKLLTAAELRKSRSCGCLRAEQLAARNRAGAGRGMSAPERRAANRERMRRPRMPCACRWCGEVIPAPVTTQKYHTPDCALAALRDAERWQGPARRARLTPEQRERLREYRLEWRRRVAEREAAALAAELSRRVEGE